MRKCKMLVSLSLLATFSIIQSNPNSINPVICIEDEEGNIECFAIEEPPIQLHEWCGQAC